MNTEALSKAITRTLLLLIFFGVCFFSLLLSSGLTWETLAFSVFKALMAVFLGWFFLLILSDSLVKSIASSAISARAKRLEGGLTYHFLHPDAEEQGEKEDEEEYEEDSIEADSER